MNEVSHTSQLAAAIGAELDTLQRRNEELQDKVESLDRALALSQQDCDTWKRRALDAEATKDQYGMYCVELVSRIVNLTELGQLMSKVCTELVQTAKRAAHKGTGLPAKQLNLGPEEEARIANIAKTFGYQRSGSEQDNGDKQVREGDET